jgi:hypothetical protein
MDGGEQKCTAVHGVEKEDACEQDTVKYLNRDGQGLFSRYYVSIYLKELKKSTENAIRIAGIPTLNIMSTTHKYYTLDRNAE